MKVLFLDFDGVINTFMHFSHEGNFSKAACKNVQSLLDKVPDLKVVISSSWRKFGLDFDKNILLHNCIDSKRVIGVTEDEKHDGKGDRGYHIRNWLKDHPEVTAFVIVDDESDMDELFDKLVKTNGFVGMTEKDVQSAIDILNKQK